MISESHLKEIRKKPCAVCNGGTWNMDKGEYQNQAHHIVRKGMGAARRDDMLTIPVCAKCHQLLHNSPDQFRKLYGADKYSKFMCKSYDIDDIYDVQDAANGH